MRAGFEALTEGSQDIWGEVSASVRVPSYASWERPLVFIVFNGVFSPIGISDPFHVTNDEGHGTAAPGGSPTRGSSARPCETTTSTCMH